MLSVRPQVIVNVVSVSEVSVGSGPLKDVLMERFLEEVDIVLVKFKNVPDLLVHHHV